MKFAVVKGNVVCTRKDPALRGIKLYVMQPLTEALQPCGQLYVAADAVGVGPGEIVMVVFSGDAPEAFPLEQMPVDAAIVGVVGRGTLETLQASGAERKVSYGGQ